MVSSDKGDLRRYQTPEPDTLELCAEFRVDSQSVDEHLCGQIDVRVEPKRLGVRLAGETQWQWIEWHTLVALGEEWPSTFRELFAEQQELAREKGLAEAINEIHSRPVGDAICRVDPRSKMLHLIPKPKKPRTSQPDDAA
jgi:hypothetical protein